MQHHYYVAREYIIEHTGGPDQWIATAGRSIAHKSASKPVVMYEFDPHDSELQICIVFDVWCVDFLLQLPASTCAIDNFLIELGYNVPDIFSPKSTIKQR